MNSIITTPPLPQTSSAPAAAPGELLTQDQLAARLGISRRTLHTWIRHKTVPMIKVRGFCRFEYHKVLAALQQHEQTVETKRSQGIEKPARLYDGCSIYGALQSLRNTAPTTPIR